MTQISTLLTSITPEMYQILCDLCSPEKPLEKSFTEIVKILQDFLDHTPSLWARQHKFINRTQSREESILDYNRQLKKLAIECEFYCDCGKSTSDSFLQLQFIRGLVDDKIRTRILKENRKLTYKEIVELAISTDMSQNEAQITTFKESVLQVQKESQYLPRTSGFNTRKPKTYRLPAEQCYRCGDKRHRAQTCKLKDVICNYCNLKGHIAKVCLKRINRVDNQHCISVDKEIESERVETVNEINIIQTNMNDKFMVTVEIGGRTINMEYDTGASLSTISLLDFKQMNITNKIFKSNIDLRTYTGERIKPYGAAYVTYIVNSEKYYGKLYIINSNVDPIFGREWIRETKLNLNEVNTLKIDNKTIKLDNFLQEFNEIFNNNIGEIDLVEKSAPIAVQARRVPYALEEKVEKEIERLEKLNVLTKVEDSDRGTPVVPILKPNGEVRLCADYKVTLNRCIKDERHPIPRIEDIFVKMNGGKYFCTLDLTQAYLHMVMDEESALLQTINAQKGLYKVNRLMFGVKIAPGLWQKFMDKLFNQLQGVQCFLDDIIIQGPTLEIATQRLRKVMEILRTHNLRLNKEKCFFLKEV